MTRWGCRAAARWGRPLPPPRTPSRRREPVAAALCTEIPKRSRWLLLRFEATTRPVGGCCWTLCWPEGALRGLVGDGARPGRAPPAIAVVAVLRRIGCRADSPL